MSNTPNRSELAGLVEDLARMVLAKVVVSLDTYVPKRWPAGAIPAAKLPPASQPGSTAATAAALADHVAATPLDHPDESVTVAKLEANATTPDTTTFYRGDGTWQAVGDISNPMTTPADLIVGGTSGAPARLAKGSDGQVLTVDPATHLLVWATPTGGTAGGYENWVDTPPASPSTYDDEFRSSTLDAQWTAALTGSPTYDIDTTWPSALMVAFTSGTQALDLVQSFVPGSGVAFSITACMYLAPQVDNQNIIIMVDDGTAANTVDVSYKFDGGAVRADLQGNNASVFSRTARNTVPLTNKCYMHIQRNTSNVYHGYWSDDGHSWLALQSGAARTVTFQIARLHLNVSNVTVPARCGYDWVRVNWLTL